MPIDLDFIERYARPPPTSTVERAVSLHENVRSILGAEFRTFLQGSYKNDTALAEMNDVDIVALSIADSRHPSYPSMWFPSPKWPLLFEKIERALEADHRYRGKWSRGDKCIRLKTEVNLDIVPAIHAGNHDNDPIFIHSFKQNSDRRNEPRLHYAKGVEKNQRTKGAYKLLVRLVKRWMKCTKGKNFASSYCVECLIHAMPDASFTNHTGLNFLNLIDYTQRLSSPIGWLIMDFGSRIPRVSGEGNIMDEWKTFDQFKVELGQYRATTTLALSLDENEAARAAWRVVFGGYNP